MASFAKFNAFVADVANKVHNLGSDSLKVALFTTATAPTSADATFDTSTTHQLNSSGSTEVANGSGYTAGGTAVGSVTSTQSSGTYKLVPSSPNITWTASGTVSNIRYAVIYNNTAGSAGARPLVGYWDYGAGGVSLNSGDTFTVQLDGSAGILQLA